ADQLASQIAIIDHGKVIAQGTPAELKALTGREVIEVRARKAADLPDLARALAHVGSDRARLDAATNRLTLAVSAGPLAISTAVRTPGDLGTEVDDIGLRRPTWEEVFLAMTGAPAESAEDEPAA